MADNRRYLLNPQLDISQILLEAKRRWLRSSEICEIICNYEKFRLTPDPPCKPPSGSLFLFDRKALRYFRKDGHCWRKKKDGKTLREAHEKLKSGSVDVLHCYYAHGEENENFQRRSYWMLEGQLEHIVLVHYREVQEGHGPGTFRALNTDQGTAGHTGGAQSSSAPCSAEANSPVFTVQLSYASTPSTTYWNGQAQSSEPEDVDSGDDHGVSSPSWPASCSGFQISSLHVDGSTGKNTSGKEGFSESFGRQRAAGLFGGASFDHNIYSSSRSDRGIARSGADFITRKLTDSIVDPPLNTFMRDTVQGGQEEESFQHVDFPSNSCAENDLNYKNMVQHKHGFKLNSQFDEGGSNGNIKTSRQSLGFETAGNQSLNNALESSLCDDEGNLKKLDSFGRWMNKEIGKDCDDSLMASDSCNYWNNINTENNEKEVSSLSCHIQLDTDSLGPSLSQEQLFSIIDYSPDWSYSGVETKVLITGTFLVGVEHPVSKYWCCMFGDVEAPAEVLTNDVLRCQVPAHAPGVVPFYITCSNRLACSEVREFEYREKLAGPLHSIVVKNDPQEEMQLQIRLTKMLFRGADKKYLDCSVQQCEKCRLNRDILSMQMHERSDWCMVEKATTTLEGNLEKPRHALMQILLKDRLYEWLVCRTHEEGTGPNVLDEDGQGVIHLAAALGYDWAVGPIVAAGVNPSFRDSCGRTGLHWAAYFGREKTVILLISLGAASGAVEDPTSSFPEGRTAADLASSRGHKGIAGYLAEADLTSHLSSLTLKEGIMDNISANLAAENAIEIVKKESIVPLDGDNDSMSLKGSLAAMRNSAQAAARIQAAFRVYSFCQRRLKEFSDDSPEITAELVALASSSNKPQKVGHFSDSLHAAAIRIQQKYRGWKGQKDFLKIRNRIVKIQAHVRGHQAREQYKKVIWSVSIVEKAILRWRRKGVGLRGFQADQVIGDAHTKTGKIDEYDFLRVGRRQKTAAVEKALARVQSMVRHPEAREQYMRLATNFQKAKMMVNEGNESMKKRLEERKVDQKLGMCMADQAFTTP